MRTSCSLPSASSPIRRRAFPRLSTPVPPMPQHS
jgi:hypothetical protein